MSEIEAQHIKDTNHNRTHHRVLSGTRPATISSNKPKFSHCDVDNIDPRPVIPDASPRFEPPPQLPKHPRRSLSFQIPLRVSTDTGRLSHNRSRARSLPAKSNDKSSTHISGNRRSLSTTGQSPLATSKPIYVAESASSLDETTPTEHFLQARGLPSFEPQDPSSAEALRDQVAFFLTTMSTP